MRQTASTIDINSSAYIINSFNHFPFKWLRKTYGAVKSFLGFLGLYPDLTNF